MRAEIKSILVVAAHPDDEVLGCGGTVARLSAEVPVHIAILGEGITSRQDSREMADPQMLTALHQNCRRVAEQLGAREHFMMGLPDNRFDELPLLNVIKKVEELIARLKPSVIFTHHPGDLNIDHAITFRAVLTATRPTLDCPVHEVYSFEVPSSTEWAFQRYEPAFRPNVFSDVAKTLDAKIKAMETYESERRSFPHPRSSEALRVIARRWGTVAGLEYAEAFELIRSVW